MPEATQTDETTYDLSDLEIVTLGLVKRASVGIYGDGENVFLTKHDDKESSMADELDIEQVDENPATDEALSKSDQSLLQKFLTFIKGEIAKANPVALAQAARILTAGGYSVTAAKLASLLGADDDEDEETEMSGKPYKAKAEKVAKSDDSWKSPKGDTEITDEGGTEPVTEPTTTVTKSLDEQLAEIQKANDARLEAIEKALEEKYKTQLEALQKQAEDAKTEVEKATEARERREWIEKADEMTLALPTSRDELAGHLHAISKAAPDHIEFLTALLKAADHALTEAGLFNEKGTSRVAEEVEVLEKAEKLAKEKGIPLADALLELTPAEQAELTKGFKEAK